MTKKILFVEDEQWGVTAYFRELGKYGIQCILARNGDDALELLKQEKFDILSLDIMFPPGKLLGENLDPAQVGYYFLEKVRSDKEFSLNANIKVVVLTAVIGEIERKIKAFGIHAYLVKPVEFQIAIETFKNLT